MKPVKNSVELLTKERPMITQNVKKENAKKLTNNLEMKLPIEKPCDAVCVKDDEEDEQDWDSTFKEAHQRLTEEIRKKLEDLKFR